MAALSALAGCGGGGSVSTAHGGVVITALSLSDSNVSTAQLAPGSYSIQLNARAKPASNSLILALSNGHGGYDVNDGTALQDGGTVKVTTPGVYGVLGLNLTPCHPASVILTPAE
jgi:hypothetical protein